MAFYGERFRRDDEEDIWEELKQMLMNPIPKEEMTLKQQQEQAKIDAVLEKMFPTDVKHIKAQEPYLRYEDLLDDTSKNESRKISLTNSQNDIASKIDIPEKIKEVRPIEEMKDAAEQIKTKAGEVFTKDNLKKAAGVGLQVASVIPQTRNVGVLAKGASVLGKKLAPKLGRKLAQEISEGVTNGAVSGALEGLGRGVLTDEDPLKTTLQDTAIGATLGAAGGAVGGNVQKVVKGKDLKKMVSLKELRKKETEYYKDYIQGTKTQHDRIGDIQFTQSGLETVSKQPKAGQDFPSVKNDIKKAEYVNYEQPYHKKHGTKDNIRGFYKLKKDSKEFLIADTPDGAKYYMSKKIGDVSNRPSRVEPTSPNSIIQPLQNNLNPSQQSNQKMMSYDEWLEELKRKRRMRGW